MKLFQETTQWPDSTSNHAYYMDDSKNKMYAYIKAGDSAVFKFKNPIRIDTRGRKFREIPDTNNFTVEETTNPNRWEVTGSKGDLYIVRLEDGVYSCSCSGFQFRGSCKHVQEFSK
jgi:uncharacterized Zn finger protein